MSTTFLNVKAIIRATLCLAVLGCAFFVVKSIAFGQQKGGRPQVKTTKIWVLVAKNDLEIGMRLIEPKKLFKKKQITEDREFWRSMYINSHDDLAAAYLNRYLRKGDAVRTIDLVTDIENLTLPTLNNTFDFRVRTTDVNLAKSLLGKRVDVIWFVKDKATTKERSWVLQFNVPVLKVQRVAGKVAKSGRVEWMVTVGLSNEEAVSESARARNYGSFRLVVRKEPK